MSDHSSDQEMDVDFIQKPSVPFRRLFRPSTTPMDNLCSNHEQLSPTTPPNVDPPLSPLSTSHAAMEEEEFSLIRRVGTNRSFINRLRFTSTPVPSNASLSKTLPPQYPHQMVDPRQNKSVDTSVTIGTDKIPIQYVNPFTPDGKVLSNKSSTNKSMQSLNLGGCMRKVFNLDETLDSLKSDSEVEPPPRCRLSEFNVSRFNEEFIKLEELGSGVHGCVYKCVNRLNGCVYAIKRTIKPIRSSTQEHFIRKEIYAHAILDHPNIVRNYSCWKEDGFVYIQNEYCNGGSFDQYIATNKMNEDMLRSFLLQMASALSYLHKKGLAHMDIKPENILLSIEKTREGSIDSDGGYSDGEKVEEEITFKLGDLGHITRLDDEDVEEGDCRYLSREILKEEYHHLDRADIFALGLTVYEAAGGGPLPKNGETWQEIRDGTLKNLTQHSEGFNAIIKEMVHPEPTRRPSALDLMKQLKLSPMSSPVDDIYAHVHRYRLGNQVLQQKTETRGQYIKALLTSHKQLQEQLTSPSSRHDRPLTPIKDRVLALKKKGAVTKSRLVGKKTTRSFSATAF